MRHGLAHLVAGELAEEEGAGLRFMSSILDHMTLEERRADLYALADLLPDRTLAGAVITEPSPERGLRWMEGQVQQFAATWSRERVRDRAQLRWDLFFFWRGRLA
jgi:hypothetical protein